MDNTLQAILPKKKKSTNPRKKQGFFESLGEISDSIKTSIKEDVIKGTGKALEDQIFNKAAYDAPPAQMKTHDDFDFAQWIKAKEEEIELQKEEEMSTKEKAFKKAGLPGPENIIYSRQDEEINREIQAILQEIKLIADAMQEVDQNIEQAISQEIVNPGTYHISFFQKIRIALVRARKSLTNGELWHEMWSSRSSRSAYWKGFKTGGTSFMLSSERTLATQTG